MGASSPAAVTDPGPVRRVAMLCVHTSPLDQPGSGDGGGLNVTVRELAVRLAARGVEVDVFTRRADPDLAATTEFADGVRLHHVEAGPPRPIDKREVANHLCGFLLALQRHPTAGTHDVVHGHYWLSGWVGRRFAARFEVPLVQTFHTLGVLKNATLAPGDRPEPALRLVAEERVAHAADRVLALTAGEARLLERTYGLRRPRIAIVPAGVDLARFSPGQPRRRPGLVGSGGGAGLVGSGGGPGLVGSGGGPGLVGSGGGPGLVGSGGGARAPRLLFVGRLQPLKGPDVAVRTLAELRRQLPDARLRIVGGASGNGHGTAGPEELARLAARLGVGDAVEFEPPLDQDELANRYRAADVVLVPSRSETFGLVALEAQACGTPVVAADVPGLESVVGGGGTLVAGHDPADHAAAALAYLTDPDRTAAAAAAGLRTARCASWDASVGRLLEVYAEVVGARAAIAV